jgi:hypothetical protein
VISDVTSQKAPVGVLRFECYLEEKGMPDKRLKKGKDNIQPKVLM